MNFKKLIYVLIICVAVCSISLLLYNGQNNNKINESKKQMQNLFGENQRIIGKYDKLLAATCNNGIFVGKEDNGVISYKGIPYAQPPIGNLRWKKPLEAKDNKNVYQAYYFGKSAIQTEAASERASLYKQSEDCLSLNVWTSNQNINEKKPVMVFIHGGSYGWGGTSDPIYEGHNFIEENNDVVLVTINYRIGIMGFIDFTDVDGGEEFLGSGNLGLLDQICALKWVQKNITSFGGDPENVTVFGESAGAGSVSLLPLIDDAKGLFKRIIAQSGSITLTYSKKECQNLTKQLLKNSGATCMNDLMTLSEDKIKELNESLNEFDNFPERDGIILPEDLYQAYSDGKGSNSDMLIGTNADEVRYWIGELGGYLTYKLSLPVLYENNVNRISKKDMSYLESFMQLQKDKPIWNQTEFYNEIMFRIPAIVQATNHSKNGGNTYMYYWTKSSKINHYGACHAVELAYVFNNLNETIYIGEKADSKLAKTVQKMWVNFAKTGNPSTEEHQWKNYDDITRNTMLLGDNIKLVSDQKGEQRQLLEPLLKYRFNGCYSNLNYNVPFIRKIIFSGLVIIGITISVVIVVFKRRKKRE